MKDRIYKILYDKSRANGVRVLYEDEWPIEELETLLAEERKKIIEEIIKDFGYYHADLTNFDGEVVKTIDLKFMLEKEYLTKKGDKE